MYFIFGRDFADNRLKVSRNFHANQQQWFGEFLAELLPKVLEIDFHYYTKLQSKFCTRTSVCVVASLRPAL